MIILKIIESYFIKNGYPNQDIEILQGMIVRSHNSENFVTSMIRILKAHQRNDGYMAYYLHLLNYYNKVKEIDNGLNKHIK